MGLYETRILPCVIHLAMRNRKLADYRRHTISAAEGQVLEVGIGSGLNLPLYSRNVERVIGIDPSPRLLAMARRSSDPSIMPVDLIGGSAEALPLPDECIDTVVTTWTLCTIADPVRALSEMRRVLAPAGRLLFVEHGRAPDAAIERWQDRLTPLWKRLGGGCHLNRAISHLVTGAGFKIERLDTGYLRGRNPVTFLYEGTARP